MRSACHHRKDIPNGNRKYDAETAKEWRIIKKQNGFNMKELAEHLKLPYSTIQRILAEF